MAPVYLPHGAYVTRFTVYYYDNTDFDDVGLYVSLRSHHITDPIREPDEMSLMEITSSGASDSVQQSNDHAVEYNIIDTQNRTYSIYLGYSQHTYRGWDMRFYGCRIEYLIDTVTP